MMKISSISTLDSVLLTGCRFILVKGGAKCQKILAAKAQRQNKILKKREELSYYVEEQKSKEYWVLIHAYQKIPL